MPVKKIINKRFSPRVKINQKLQERLGPKKQTFLETLNKINNPTERILVENFVSLQRVMTNLSLKFDHLSNQISKLLEIFEISARSLSQNKFSFPDNKEINQKLDNLLEQNKTLAKGLTLLHEKPEDRPRPSGFSRPMTKEEELQRQQIPNSKQPRIHPR